MHMHMHRHMHMHMHAHTHTHAHARGACAGSRLARHSEGSEIDEEAADANVIIRRRRQARNPNPNS